MPNDQINQELVEKINSLGKSADLLVRHDEWLETQRKAVQQNLLDLSDELKSIFLAQQIKRILREQGLVAVQNLIKNSNGNVVDVVISIVDKSEANNSDAVIGQIVGWHSPCTS